MELKNYQKKVIQDLEQYLVYLQHYRNAAKAFAHYWETRVGPYDPLTEEGMRPYQNIIPNVPHVCVKVPTAGGKTFIACNALPGIFNLYPPGIPKAVVWLVPWSNLLDQTVAALRNPDHPYRQKLNSLFNHRVEVYEKLDLLQGSNFNPTIVQEQLSVFVMSFASLRAKNKEDRKVNQENSNLASFSEQYKDKSFLLEEVDDTSLINVIRSLRPVVIVDESHNAESALSVEMLQSLNPSFILDLTATPKNNSNIISLVPALELKKEQMVKLPVIVYNHHNKTEVINSALYLQRELERLADFQLKAGGRYIRPIVLFQAQPKTAEDNTTFEKIKEQLINSGIEEERIKIKTAQIDELKGIDLSSPACEVRYIITVNALKEGWDCPFAYILASLADKSSAVDVEQILGRILRQPYVQLQQESLLNNSYVLTASAKFNETLENIVENLKIAGFSEKNYRAKNRMSNANMHEGEEQIEGITFHSDDFIPESFLSIIHDITTTAIHKNEEMAEMINNQDDPFQDFIFSELKSKSRRYKIVEKYQEIISSIKIPQFLIPIPSNNFFEEDNVLLNVESLLDEGFKLDEMETISDITQLYNYISQIDINLNGESTIQSLEDNMAGYMRNRPREKRASDMVYQFMQMIKDVYSISEHELRNYFKRELISMNEQTLDKIYNERFNYIFFVKNRIKQHIYAYAENRFYALVQEKKIIAEPTWKFPDTIELLITSAAREKSLYEKEASMNNLETEMIQEIAMLPNIVFWHRNRSRGKGFCINGYKSNHYPDFILYTLSGKIILLEVKGNDRDNSDSAEKCKLGNIWGKLAGNNYHYMMVFKENNLTGAYSLKEAVEKIKQL